MCGIDLVDNVSVILQADKVVSLAWDGKKKCNALSDDLVYGCSLLKLGNALCRAEKSQEALYYMNQAKTMFKDVGNTLSLSHAYQSISWVHYAEHRLSDVLDTIEEAWKYAELANSNYNQMSISLDLSRILFNAN